MGAETREAEARGEGRAGVRVIAGTARGLRIQAPEGRDTRPTGDRVREAVFNALTSLDALEEATVLDLFAGSGALGIEALSRGAAHATFVDTDRRAIRLVEANLAATGLADRALVRSAPADRVVAEAVEAGLRWDLALLDPPYAFDDWDALLLGLPADLAVVESDRSIPPPPGWGVVRERRYGTTLVAVLRSTPSTGSARGTAPSE
ncbi:MAG TPA: 16S rRNA (guanine(966)-N(2))-methyltransferase RsmD [Acidimicrobiales bacterium]